MGKSSENRPISAGRRIDEELVCVDSLSHVLFACCECKDVHVHREEHDPPDFTVTIDGQQFPTEVTSIVSRHQYHAHCKEFAKAIHDSADSLGILSGTYAFIVFRLPAVPKPRSRNGCELLDAAVAYIEATKQQAQSTEMQLKADRSGRITIMKLSATGSAVGPCWTPPAMWEGDIRNVLAGLMQQSIDVKRRKLTKAGFGPGKVLLLFYDAFGYAEPDDAIAALQQVTGYNWFHSIFWVPSFFDRPNTTYPAEPGREGFFLFSNKTAWEKVGTVPLETGTQQPAGADALDGAPLRSSL